MKITLKHAFATLGVAHGASEEEARSAYRKLALQFHPDKNPHEEATAKFQEISAAYKKVCDYHKHRSTSGGNQGGFFFDEDEDYDEESGDFGFDDIDLEDLEPTFEEMLMMFEMMFGPTKSTGKNKKKPSVGSNKKGAASTAKSASSTTEGTAPGTKVPVPIGGRVGKARRSKAPNGKTKGRGLDPFGGFLDPEMMMFEQFMDMSMNDPDLSGMDGDLMEEMMNLFAEASDEDIFGFSGGRRKGRAKNKSTKPARVESSDEEIEEVSDWEDEGEVDKETKPKPPSKADESGGNQVDASSEPVKVGSRVHVHGKHVGSVKFIGPVHYSKGEFVGVELDDPEGKNDGSLKGVEYFKCKPRHGVMVRREDVSLAGTA